jgi:hypothetical protein
MKPCALLLCTILLFGCTVDEVGGFRADGGLDETGVPDATDATDSTSDSNSGIDPTIDAPVVPDQPADNTLCNEHGWCWLHPGPFPYDLDSLQRVGQDVHGVAYSEHANGFETVIWDGESTIFGPRPDPVLGGLEEMTTTNSGWLAAEDHKTVHDIRTNGVRGEIELDGEDFYGVSGSSADSFVAYLPEETVLVRDGETRRFDRPDNVLLDPVMWSDGTIWTLTNSGMPRQRLDGDWQILPVDAETFGPGVTAFGPDPSGPCAALGLFAGVDGDSLRRVYPTDQRETLDYMGARIESIGCSPDGELLVGDAVGTLHTRSADGTSWEQRDLLDGPIRDIEALDSELYVAGTKGRHVIVEGEATTRLGSGFSIPSRLTQDKTPGFYSDIWASPRGEELVLMHTHGIFHGTPEGWYQMPMTDGVKLNHGLDNDEVWGVEEPQFAISHRTLMRWTGRRWVDITERAVGEPNVQMTDIAGQSEDAVWLLASNGIHRYDGESWTHLTREGSQLAEDLDSYAGSPSSLQVKPDGTKILGFQHLIWQILRGSDGWRLKEIDYVECDEIRSTFTQDGVRYVAGRDGCASHNPEGDWQYLIGPNQTEQPPTSSPSSDATIVPHPVSDTPLFVTPDGIFGVRDGLYLDYRFRGVMRDAVYLEERNIVLALHRQGVVAKYY